jgi:hypothetical protein
MQFEFVFETFNVPIDLRVLKRSVQKHHVLLYQHEGELTASAVRIGNAGNATASLNSFFDKARTEDADLALTPEYCCPWENIEKIIRDETLWPNPTRLWVIGAESITIEQLTAFDDQYNQNNVIVAFDRTLLAETNNFFDPVVYLFRTTIQDVSKLFILIQFKTMPMSVWSGDVENSNIILGKKIYILRNATDSIHFMTLICSEAMNFYKSLSTDIKRDLGWTDLPYLIFNPQCNSSPAHKNFSDFRQNLFEQDKKELIGLNWHRNSIANGKTLIPNKSSRSGIYSKSPDIPSQRIETTKQNHQKGLCYFTYKQHKYAFLLNSAIHISILHVPPVSIDQGVELQQARYGPMVSKIFSMDHDGIVTELPEVSDDHMNYLNEVGCKNPFLVGNNCIIEKERLVCLSSGCIPKSLGSSWKDLDNLYSVNYYNFQEVNYRITVGGDTEQLSLIQKKVYINAIYELEKIITGNQDKFPESVSYLKDQNLQIGYHADSFKDYYRYNIIAENGEKISATFCFLDRPMDDEIESSFDHLQGMFENSNNASTVVIFYKRGDDLKVKYDKRAGKITNTQVGVGPSINKPS